MEITVLNVEVNLLTVLAATVSTIALGMIWYHPKTPTGQRWMKLTNIKMDGSAGNPMMAMGLSSIASFVTAFILYILIVYVGGLNDYSEVTAAVVTAILATIIVSMTTVNNVLFEDKPKSLWLLNTAFTFSTYLANCLVIAFLL